MRSIVIIASLLFSAAVSADEVFLGYGMGVVNSTDSRDVNLGFRKDLSDGFFWQFKGGLWVDNSGDPTRSNSGFVSSGPGFLVDFNPIEIRTSVGLAAITSPDSILGGPFPQFNEDLYVGVRDKRGNGVGFVYEHISSAGIEQPNYGRDFIELQWSKRW